jgi:hypothetical protein
LSWEDRKQPTPVARRGGSFSDPEGAMTQAELEAELVSLKADVGELRARDERRIARSRSVIKATTFVSVLFTVVYVGFVVAAVWMRQHDLMLWASPIMFAGIALSFVNQSLGVWRVESDPA